LSIELKDGSSLWKTEMRGGALLWTYPAVMENRVFVGGMGAVYCFDADTGETLWKYEVESTDFYSHPIVVNNRVIMGSGGAWELEAYENARKITCLDAGTGEVLWDHELEDLARHSPAHYEGRIYVNAGRYVCCMDLETGGLFWKTDLGEVSFSGLSLDGRRIFLGISDGIACLDMERGDLLWNFKCGEMVFRCPAGAHFPWLRFPSLFLCILMP
jgi:outer membrane protein assembly factor BamB